MTIPFTQYLRPDGRPRDVEVDRPPDIEALARQFIESGGRYECEHLTTGEASLTAVKEIDGEEQDIAIEIVPNGPEVPAAVDRLVRASAARFADTEVETKMTQHTPNARLIVAAPDLLDALEQALDDMGGEGHCVCETVKQQMRAAVAKATQPMTDEQSMITTVARAICKSRTCEGVNCCQWPANRGRIKCPVDAGGYDDAAFEAILAMGAAESDTSLRDRFGLGRDEKIA